MSAAGVAIRLCRICFPPLNACGSLRGPPAKSQPPRRASLANASLCGIKVLFLFLLGRQRARALAATSRPPVAPPHARPPSLIPPFPRAVPRCPAHGAPCRLQQGVRRSQPPTNSTADRGKQQASSSSSSVSPWRGPRLPFRRWCAFSAPRAPRKVRAAVLPNPPGGSARAARRPAALRLRQPRAVSKFSTLAPPCPE